MDWRKLKKEYIAGGISYRKLAEKYEVSRTTLERKAKDEGWPELRRQAEGKATAKVVEAVSTQNARFDRAVDLAIEAACALLEMRGASLRAVDLKDATTALKNLRDLKGIKSEADMKEQQARIEALRARAGIKDDDDGEGGGGVILISPVDSPPEEVVDGE